MTMAATAEGLEARRLMAGVPVLLGEWAGNMVFDGDHDSVRIVFSRQAGGKLTGRLTHKFFSGHLDVSGTISKDGSFAATLAGELLDTPMQGTAAGRLIGLTKMSGTVEMKSGGEHSDGTFALDLADLDGTWTGADEVEPQTPVSVRKRIDNSSDVDLFEFEGTKGQRVRLDVNTAAVAGRLDSVVRVFDRRGVPIAMKDDAGGSVDPLLDLTLPSAGRFYVGVSGAGNTRYNVRTGAGDRRGAVGAYQLIIRTLDNNNSIALARPLGAASATAGTSKFIVGSLGDGKDVDMYSFTVAAGRRVSFLEGGVEAGLRLRLFNANGAQLAISPDDGDAAIDHTFAAGGTYYLGVSAYPNKAYRPRAGVSLGRDDGGEPYQIALTTL
jgi:hypothetical protein